MTMRIVLGVDGSEHSRRASEWCAELAGRGVQLEVVAVHAIELPVYAAPGVAMVPIPDISPEDRRAVAKMMETDWCAAIAAAGVPLRCELVDGAPATAIMQVAAREKADLVVTGRRGRGGFAELLLGSTSHQLTHHLACPLVIVP